MYDIRASPIRSITVANNTTINAEYISNVDIDLLGEDGNIIHIKVKDVLYVPKLNSKLLSVSLLTKNGCHVTFEKNGCEIFNNEKKLVAKAKVVNKMYKLDTFNGNACIATSEDKSLNIWNRRMGQLNYDDVKKLPLCTE